MQRFLPLIVVAALATLFLSMLLRDRNPHEIKSVMMGKESPAFTLPALLEADKQVTDDVLRTGHPVLVNFFASWCVPCRAEHPNLMKLAREHHIPIIGINYKDDPAKARAYLAELGDPYVTIAAALRGRTGIDWGVTGVPETFIVDGNGKIRDRLWGPVVVDSIEKKILPEIEAIK